MTTESFKEFHIFFLVSLVGAAVVLLDPFLFWSSIIFLTFLYTSLPSKNTKSSFVTINPSSPHHATGTGTQCFLFAPVLSPAILPRFVCTECTPLFQQRFSPHFLPPLCATRSSRHRVTYTKSRILHTTSEAVTRMRKVDSSGLHLTSQRRDAQ